MRAFVVGFPKSGTSTLQKAFVESGLKSAHWHIGGRWVGKLIYDAYFRGDDPLADLSNFDCITQADVCLPECNLNLWPNLDLGVLSAIRRHHPQCLFILNYRPAEKIAASMARWVAGFQGRLTQSAVPGLPAGFGGTEPELTLWIDNHHKVVRQFFKDDRRFLDLELASPDAPRILSDALGIEIRWWGTANAGPAARARAIEIARQQQQAASGPGDNPV